MTCDIWTGSVGSHGYGQITVGGRSGKNLLAHRLVWMQDNGPIPDGMYVCHTCDQPLCINIDHLFLGSPSDNAQDMAAKRRHAKQQRTHCAKGHPYTPENTYRYPDGRRWCRICNNGGAR